jgi:hypothetical protein
MVMILKAMEKTAANVGRTGEGNSASNWKSTDTLPTIPVDGSIRKNLQSF